MKSAAFTIKAFGVYVTLTGLTLLFVPNLLLSLVGIAPTTEVWVRVVGALALVLGLYYWTLGTANVRPFFVASVQARLVFCAICLGLVAFTDAPAALILFGVIDTAMAVWTLMALRAEAHPG